MNNNNYAKLQKPTQDLVSKYINEFNTDDRYFPADIAIDNLIVKFPKNNCVYDVILKVATINALYSTRIMDISGMANHIVRLDIDSKLDDGNLDLVEEIATGHGIGRGSGGSRFFSFATKYCNWHRKDIYPIYDRFVEKILIAFRDKYGFSSFKNCDLKNCASLRRVILDLIDAYSLEQFNFKAIDKFLWRYGQEIFPPTYSHK